MSTTPLSPPSDYTALIEAISSLAVDFGTVGSRIDAGGNSLSDNSKSWYANIHHNKLVKIVSGSGKGQLAVIQGNSTNSLIIDGSWQKVVEAGSKYMIMNADFGQLLRDVFNSGNNITAANPLQVFDPKVWGSVSGLAISGTVTAVPGANQFTISTLAGLGVGKFSDAQMPYYAFISRDSGGLGAVPQGQARVVTGYDSVTGNFTAAAFGAAVAVGDEVIILHQYLWQIYDSYLTRIGYEGATSLADKLTAARAALLDNLANLDAAVSTRAPSATALSTATWTAALATALSSYTAARAVYLDELAAANIPADIDELKASKGRQLFILDFWSLPQEEVSIPAAAADQALPDIVVADLPAGAVVVRAVAMFKFRIVENVNVAANKLNGAQEIQIRDDSPSAWTDAINFVDDMFSIAAGPLREGGDVIIGAIDVAGTVDGNDTYNVQWDGAVADVASINFNDVQVGLRIWYSV